jgi:uncharacterized phosphosugar-binding protein
VTASAYLARVGRLIDDIATKQGAAIEQAAALMADGVARGGMVNLFGSGHSVLPVMDCFPRYGSYTAFRPLVDARLSWFNVLGTGGVRELLWLEREPGYVANFLGNYPFRDGDTMVVYSHGGLNAAPVEAALYGTQHGLPVIAVTSVANLALHAASHPSGRRLADVADVVIDNCAPPEDAVVRIEGWKAPVAATSTVSVVAITMALVAELAAKLGAAGIELPTFVSPNDSAFPSSHNAEVFEAYREATRR